MNFRIIVAIATLLFVGIANAEPGHGGWYSGTTTTEKPTPEVKVSLKYMNGNHVRSDVDVKNARHWDGLIKSYSASQFIDRIKGLPGIESVQFMPGEHKIDETIKSTEIIKSDRESALMVRVRAASPFTLMFEVKETLRRCSSDVDPNEDGTGLDAWVYSQWSESQIGVKAPCHGSSSFTVKGPIAVYGTTPGNFSDRMYLMNQITFHWEISHDSTNMGSEIDSYFKVERPDFPKAIKKLVQWTYPGNPMVELFLENAQQNALAQIGKVLHTKNQEILRGE